MQKRPYNRRPSITSEDADGKENFSINADSSIATDDIDRPDLAIVTDESMQSPTVSEYIKDLQFMEDVLTIIVNEVPDKNAENPVPAAVNGVTKFFKRGQEYRVERKFVDSLIRSEASVKTTQFKDDQNLDQTKIEVSHSLKYPISIIHDPADEKRHPSGQPLGRAWFMHQCKNA